MKAKVIVEGSNGDGYWLIEEPYEWMDEKEAKEYFDKTFAPGVYGEEECNNYRLGSPAYSYLEMAAQTDYHPQQTFGVYKHSKVIKLTIERLD